MTKKLIPQLFILILILVLLPSCSLYQVAAVANDLEYSAKFDPIEIPEEYKENFSSCRGFDFNRKFPFEDNSMLSVHYAYREQQLTNKDGLRFTFIKQGPGSIRIFHRDMKHTNKEKKYLAAYKSMEEEFDRKYAGEIKRKIDALTIRGTHNGKTSLDYPDYLKGDQLQEGLVTPASIFSYYFFADYINAEDKLGDLRRYILSTSWYKDFTMQDLARSIGRDAASLAKFRLKPLSPEYVLTYYLLKEYENAEERHRTATELADYYSSVAFRGAAESLYYYRNMLNSNRRCKIANYIATRVYDLVMVIDNPEKLSRIKKEYNEELAKICKANLANGRSYNAGLQPKQVRIKRRKAIYDAYDEGKLRCIND